MSDSRTELSSREKNLMFVAACIAWLLVVIGFQVMYIIELWAASKQESLVETCNLLLFVVLGSLACYCMYLIIPRRSD